MTVIVDTETRHRGRPGAGIGSLVLGLGLFMHNCPCLSVYFHQLQTLAPISQDTKDSYKSASFSCGVSNKDRLCRECINNRYVSISPAQHLATYSANGGNIRKYLRGGAVTFIPLRRDSGSDTKPCDLHVHTRWYRVTITVVSSHNS